MTRQHHKLTSHLESDDGYKNLGIQGSAIKANISKPIIKASLWRLRFQQSREQITSRGFHSPEPLKGSHSFQAGGLSRMLVGLEQCWRHRAGHKTEDVTA